MMKKFLFCFLFGLFIAAVYDQSAYAAVKEDSRIVEGSNALPFSGGLLDGEVLNIESSVGVSRTYTKNLTDDNFGTYEKFYPLSKVFQIRANKNEIRNVKYLRIYVDGDAPLKLRIWDDDKKKELYYTITPEYFQGKPFELIDCPTTISVPIVRGLQNGETVYEFNLYDKLPGQFENVSDMKYSATNDSLSFSYTVPENFSYLKVFVDGELKKNMVEGSSFTLDQLKPDTSYNLKVISYSKNGEISAPNNYEVKTEPLKPPSDISNVQYKFDYRSLHMTYDLPTEDNFSHLEVYKNNVKILSKVTDAELNFDDLKPSTDYTYKIVAVSDKGAKSEGYTLSFKTKEYKDEEPPEKPTGLKVTNGNESLVIAWDKNSEFDLEGYNVYLDGKKVTNKPITSNVYTVPDLENGQTYHVEVSAVDTSGNESEKAAKYGSPNTKGMPVFKAGYNLSDVSNGVGSWFSSIWLLLAFSVSIPLSFYISHRVKALFFT
ncbi:fibronectin type III domain-containing protein [Bacillus atrophaeus]|nr:fibronectin type III domain-containing protein [Bacillus atrophaeus]MCY8823089.1 fibronectin type III domain-containing protein [Bacillus atrophaeus]MEC0781645.1 fibronectin type III domain-containing protein [Bacillus atrophaeus]MEC0802402.1 fibronectin type III domain-containing protein [Bacillus atrophaeus]MEC0818844.1 fibronectin type III domain-containing protein [Bacillus atrophaeus]